MQILYLGIELYFCMVSLILFYTVVYVRSYFADNFIKGIGKTTQFYIKLASSTMGDTIF